MFHFALNPGGFLVLGLAETVGSFGDLFELVEPRAQDLSQARDRPAVRQLTFMADDWLHRRDRRSGPASSISRRATFSARPTG